MAVDDGVFHEGVMAHVMRLTYDFEGRRGILDLADMNCTSMSGCIRLFKKIDPGVELIMTRAGGEPDTCYVRVEGKWLAKEKPGGRVMTPPGMEVDHAEPWR